MKQQLRLFAVLMLSLGLGAGFGLPAWGAEPVTIWAGPSQERAVALTFDDGPSSRYTGPIMALLKRYGARGTFFVLGHKVEESPGLVRDLLKEGHEVGNHSFSHPRLTESGELTREQELERTALDLHLLGCSDSGCLFRPPYSAYDSRLSNYLAHTRRKLVLWSLDSGDWRGLKAAAIVANVLNRVRNGDIIIFHDGDETGRADRSPTVAALAKILPALKAAGYRMVTVSELVRPIKPPHATRLSRNFPLRELPVFPLSPEHHPAAAQTAPDLMKTSPPSDKVDNRRRFAAGRLPVKISR